MTGPSAAVALGHIIVARKDFTQSFDRTEAFVARTFLRSRDGAAVSEGSLHNLLRYADILSSSDEARHRETAYAIVALLREYDELVGIPGPITDHVQAVSEAVLVQLGNFPGIRTLQKSAGSRFTLPLSRGGLRAAKEVLHRSNQGDAILTDAQYAIADRMRGEDFFSFSGPTSLGKSFVLKDALYDIVRQDRLDGQCVVILVPTKALIGQTANDLRGLLANVPEVNVATYPSLPMFLRTRYRRTIFVLTPERLLRYLAEPVRDIAYLIVDEAQKVIAKNDARSSLYYHAIVESIRRFATKLIFAAPSINNPELFLELFGKSTHGALAVTERTVSQQRFFVDLVAGRQYYYSNRDYTSRSIPDGPSVTDAVDLIIALSRSRKSIIYVNGSTKSSELALRLTAKLRPVDSPKLDELRKYVGEYVHRQYYLSRTLENGVAFHHGKMPQEVRERVERAFADPESPLQYVVCTSTLLEGVNLPAKNIFVLSDKHGNRDFSKLDFENLVGRAGRLTYDFSGNVICVREEPTRWREKTQNLLARIEPTNVESFLVRPKPQRKKEYTDIARVLRGQDLPGNPSVDERRSVQQYATILMLHQIDQQQTPLRGLFLDRVGDGRELLRRATAAIEVPTEILRRSPSILPEFQNEIWRGLVSGDVAVLLSAEDDLDDVETYHEVLRRLSALYHWPDVEAQGTDPLLPNRATSDGIERRLLYWAILMRSWVRGDALSRVIGAAIGYQRRQGEIIYRDYSREESLVVEVFDATSAKHVNLVIEWTLRDIEGGLRFRIMSYLQNFFDLCLAARGRDEAGLNVAALVEYGTTDARAIQLQEVGFSRTVAAELLQYTDHLGFSASGDLDQIDEASLIANQDLSDDARSELHRIVSKVAPENVSRDESTA